MISDCIRGLMNTMRWIIISLIQFATSVVIIMGKPQVKNVDKFLQRLCHNHGVQINLNIMTS